MPEAPYSTVIERGYTPVNDFIIDYLKPRIVAPYVDLGCNTGWLLCEVPGGVGVEASPDLAQRARDKGCEVYCGRVECTPFADGGFQTAVLSCVLEQCDDWRSALTEARRIAHRVIGINPIPGASPWGGRGGWVRSVIAEPEMWALGFTTTRIDAQRYCFEG